MKWASAVADDADLAAGVQRCAAALTAALGPESPPTLLFLFVAGYRNRSHDQVTALIRAQLPETLLVGCSGGGVIGAGREVEDRPAVAMTAGYLPGVRLTPFHVVAHSLPTPDDPPDAWRRLTGVQAGERADFILLMDPFSAPARDLLAGLDFAYPSARKVGGLASGGRAPGDCTLFLGDRVYREGAVGLGLAGAIAVDTVVAQGCRPIGEPRRITACRRNLLLEVDGEPPLQYLQELYRRLDERDQQLLTESLHLGMAIDSLLTAEEAGPGDFLIRNLVGVDHDKGILAIGEFLREGQLVQFHVRDALTSTEDLSLQLGRYREGAAAGSPEGALLFQCNGRGAHLYGRANHDVELFRDNFGPVPVGGFFCNGEIGPIAGSTYLHGYTSSFALFRAP
jgi:small ligand-binding sensory domain FIST